jgi:hypothetical protein
MPQAPDSPPLTTLFQCLTISYIVFACLPTPFFFPFLWGQGKGPKFGTKYQTARHVQGSGEPGPCKVYGSKLPAAWKSCHGGSILFAPIQSTRTWYQNPPRSRIWGRRGPNVVTKTLYTVCHIERRPQPLPHPAEVLLQGFNCDLMNKQLANCSLQKRPRAEMCFIIT